MPLGNDGVVIDSGGDVPATVVLTSFEKVLQLVPPASHARAAK